MAKESAIIIGSGLGGLLCAYTLSKEGFDVTVLEKNDRIGGCIQSFVRDGVIFNTGFNYTESLGEGEVLNQYFKYFDVLDKLQFKQMDINGFERIAFDDENNEYWFAQGHDNFIETLSKSFPTERLTLQKYIDKLCEIVNHFPLYKLDLNSKGKVEEIFNIGTTEFLESLTSNRRLQNVLAGTNSLYGGVANKTPLYIHALINYSFIKSAWRLVDGGSTLAVKLANAIKANGGKIFCRNEVRKIIHNADNSQTLACNNGIQYSSKYVISSLPPFLTINMVEGYKIRNVFFNRLASMEQTIGMFSIYIVLKKNTFRYQNFNHHIYKNNNVWTADYTDWPEHYMLYTQANSKNTEFANGITILTYMKFSEVAQWANTTVGNRGADYEDFKHRRAEKLLDFVEHRFPEIRSCIDKYYTSTPLTYRDYTATINGASYGIQKDYHNALQSLILPKSPVPNLFFTGQNLNMHGILGVSIGAISTCAELLGMQYLIEKIKNA